MESIGSKIKRSFFHEQQRGNIIHCEVVILGRKRESCCSKMVFEKLPAVYHTFHVVDQHPFDNHLFQSGVDLQWHELSPSVLEAHPIHRVTYPCQR